MPTFQFYKKRDFSAYVSDTIDFFKQFGLHFLKNFVAINGAIMVLFIGVYVTFLKDAYSNAFQPEMLANAFNYDISLIIGLVVIFFLLSMVLVLFTTAFPIAYVDLLQLRTDEEITYNQIFAEMKKHFSRMIVFVLASLFTLLPLFAIYMAISFLMIFILIGIPLFLIGMAAIYVWSMQSLFCYLKEDISYFEALGKGWKILFSKFWHTIGSTFVVYICISILTSVFSMVPMFMMMGSVLTSGGEPSAIQMSPVALFFYAMAMIASFIGQNLLMIQQMLIYYSSLEQNEHYQSFSEIDSIGKNEA